MTIRRRPGLGAHLDVITLRGMRRREKGLWERAYEGRGGYPSKERLKKKCIAWKTVGKGCDCRPACASFTDPKKGTSKKAAEAKCQSRCKTRKKRRRR